jgi:nuclear pore complex protein Nup107
MQRVPSAKIALSKTKALLGDRLDLVGLEGEDDEDLTEVMDGSAQQKKLLKKYMLSEAKNYRELEAMIETLDSIETISGISLIMHE